MVQVTCLPKCSALQLSESCLSALHYASNSITAHELRRRINFNPGTLLEVSAMDRSLDEVITERQVGEVMWRNGRTAGLTSSRSDKVVAVEDEDMTMALATASER